ncbi:MAG: hypothetical protein KKB30_14630 [Proteobacteria bacterium]|nr:hypothetical protein [Pseudomonadota bacterium]MBU1717138.1 hypothetical protein [Pseudomonadota bacterium]
MKADTFFSETEKEQISNTVREVERNTAGEIAVMVVNHSDDYPESKILAGLFFGAISSLIITDLWFNDRLWLFIPTALVIGIFSGWLASYLPIVMRFFTQTSRLELQVRDQAFTSFYQNGLHKTIDETGVLFFISLFERRVWILADKGIYQKITPETLQDYAREVALGIKTGKATETLCCEIRNVGKILAAHFPIKKGDTNELPNRVIIGK